MQRTVYSTKFTYVDNEIHETEKGVEIVSTLKTITVHESEPKKALKNAIKEIGLFNPIKTEKVAELYVLNDEIFFKYATVKTDSENDSEKEGNTNE